MSNSVAPWTVAHQAPLFHRIPGKNIGVISHSLLQGIFPTQGSNMGFPHCKQMLYLLSHQGSSVYMYIYICICICVCICIYNLQTRLQDLQGGFRKGRGNRDQIVNICWIIEKAREIQ